MAWIWKNKENVKHTKSFGFSEMEYGWVPTSEGKANEMDCVKEDTVRKEMTTGGLLFMSKTKLRARTKATLIKFECRYSLLF